MNGTRPPIRKLEFTLLLNILKANKNTTAVKCLVFYLHKKEACPRLSDSGEDAKVKGTCVRDFSIPADPTFSANKKVTRGPFLQSPDNFSGPISNIQIEIKRIRAERGA